MGISDEAARLRENVPEQFRVAPHTQPLSGSFADPADIDLIFADPAENTVAEVERRNHAATENGDKLNQDRLAENAGIRAGRIEITGLGGKEKERISAQEKAKAAADARMQTLLALQAQLGDLYDERDKGLADYLSPEELAEINALDREDQDKAIRDIMREKLENGDISRDKYDEWKAWYDNWSQREAKLQNTIGRVQSAETKEQLERVVKDVGAVTGEKAAEKVGGAKGQVVEVESEKLDDTGSAAQKNSESTLMAAAFGGFDLGGSGTSFANNASPDTQMRSASPPMQHEFKTASAQTETVAPDAKVELAIQQNLGAAIPTNNVG